MQFWLFKSEPGTWSWEDQVNADPPCQEWDGVRNYQARNFMRQMKLGDLGFFYHSVNEKRIVGIVEVCREAHPDSTSDDPRWECVDVQAKCPMTRPVSLDEIKADPRLSEMVLVKNSRLSVQPVRPEEWRIICEMAGFEKIPGIDPEAC